MATVAPPAKAEISAPYPSPNNGEARIGFGKLWDYVTNLLGLVGSPADARAALGVVDSSDTTKGLVELATNAEALAGTDTTRAITPSNLRAAFGATGNPPMYAARAVCNFDGTGTPSMHLAFNVSSITDNGTGDYTVNFITAMPDIAYAIVGSTVGSGSGGVFIDSRGAAPTTGGCRFGTFSSPSAALVDAGNISVVIFR